MPADDMAPDVARSLSAMILTLWTMHALLMWEWISTNLWCFCGEECYKMQIHVHVNTKQVSIQSADTQIYSQAAWQKAKHGIVGLILGLLPANERRRYKVTPSLIGRAQT